jgi:CNT family concentrative nucleoside transporter
MLQLQSAFGVVALLAIAWAWRDRRAASLRQALIGLVATVLTAVVMGAIVGVLS